MDQKDSAGDSQSYLLHTHSYANSGYKIGTSNQQELSTAPCLQSLPDTPACTMSSQPGWRTLRPLLGSPTKYSNSSTVCNSRRSAAG